MRSDPRRDRDGSPRRLLVELEWPFPPDQVIVLTGGLPTQFIGVTGLDTDDCRRLVGEAMGDAVLRVRREVWDVDVSSLDGRVTTGNPAALGVWYRGP